MGSIKHLSRFSLAAVAAIAVAVSFVSAAEPAPASPTIRIKAGLATPLTDETGVVWQGDRGFADGDTIERPELAIANTKTPSVYRAERYAMSKFTQKLPNGKYLVKLHFAETFEEINAPGQRVFSFRVGAKEFKDFDPFAAAGGALRAWVVSVPVEITDGQLEITFMPKIENPEINAIEILPAA
jgi:hypothetical protein